MSYLLSLSRPWAGLVVGFSLMSGPFVQAQEDQSDSGIEYPLQVIHCASVDRVQTKADALFEAAGRPEMSDLMQNWIDTTLRGVKGMDRTKPFGMMVYIKPGLTPGIFAVSYLPVTDIQELLLFLAGESGVVRDVTGESHQYEITEVDWGPDLAIQHKDDYVYMTSIDDSIELSRRFPSPERLVSKLTNRYDIAYSLLLKNIPPATKTLFLEFFKTQAEAGIQRRDEEPEAAYRIRRANGESLIDLLDMVVRQGEEFTIGGFANIEDQSGYIEVELNGAKDSGLARFCQDMAGRRSYFEPVLSEASTFTLSASIQLDEKRRKPFMVLFEQATTVIEEGLRVQGQPDASAAQASPFFRSLLNTAEDGQIDTFVQLLGTKPGDYCFVGALRVLGAGNFPEQLKELLSFGKDAVAGTAGAEGRAILDGAQLDESSIDGHSLHVLPLPKPNDEMGLAMVGEKPNLYLCATPQALWYAIGPESAKEQLTAAIESIGKAEAPSDAPKRQSAPVLFTTRATHWVDLSMASVAMDPTSDVAEGATGLSPALAAFAPENDEMRLTARPTDTGFRVRAEFQPGYFAWFGGLVTQQIDEQLANAGQRDERRRARAAERAKR